PPPVFVPERQRQKEVADRHDSLGGQTRRANGTQVRDPPGGIAQRQHGGRHTGRGSRLSPYDGFQKVRITRPNPTRSPWRTATGTPVASLTLLTKVPLTTPISSIRYSASPMRYSRAWRRETERCGSSSERSTSAELAVPGSARPMIVSPSWMGNRFEPSGVTSSNAGGAAARGTRRRGPPLWRAGSSAGARRVPCGRAPSSWRVRRDSF